MSFAIHGTIVKGIGGATDSTTRQRSELRKYLPQIDECHPGTINVYLYTPLDIRIADVVTPPIKWHHDVPAERFSLTKIELELLQKRHEAWIYLAEFTHHRFNYKIAEVIAQPLEGVAEGLSCILHIDRLQQGIVVV